LGIFILSVILISFLYINDYKLVEINDGRDNFFVITKFTKAIDVINHKNIFLSPADLIFPSPSAKMPKFRGKITINRADEIIKTKFIEINQEMVEIQTAALPSGRRLVINPGAKGYREEIYRSIWLDGVKIKEELIDVKNICKPRKGIALIGNSKKYFDFYKDTDKQIKKIIMRASAYSPSSHSCAPFDDGMTAIGLRADYGIAAVDPKIIPLGSLLYIEGYGYAIAGDVGSSIKKNYIDLCFPNHKTALEFGVRQVNVFVLE
ncbi:MAG TPA: 3D domain-containing protein, partial [bacterium]|nr:3D domain-containing protein [bacterium]